MKVVYIAGPYRHKGKHDGSVFTEITHNIMEARRWAIKVWQAGGVALCPHLNTYHMELDANLSEDTILSGDLELLRSCDAILLIPGWENSSGARTEAVFARNNHIPIFHAEMQGYNGFDDLETWLKVQSNG